MYTFLYCVVLFLNLPRANISFGAKGYIPSELIYYSVIRLVRLRGTPILCVCSNDSHYHTLVISGQIMLRALRYCPYQRLLISLLLIPIKKIPTHFMLGGKLRLKCLSVTYITQLP
jgi:hypothetical protein